MEIPSDKLNGGLSKFVIMPTDQVINCQHILRLRPGPPQNMLPLPVTTMAFTWSRVGMSRDGGPCLFHQPHYAGGQRNEAGWMFSWTDMIKEKMTHHNAIATDCLAKHPRGLSIAMIIMSSHQIYNLVEKLKFLAGCTYLHQHSQPPGVIDWNSWLLFLSISLSSLKWTLIATIIVQRGNLC